MDGGVITETRYLGGAVPPTDLYTLAAFDNRGTISGDVSGTMGGAVRVSYGDDRVENAGTITGRVWLGDGDDTFVQHAGATLGGVVSGGWGDDLFMVVADEDGARG